MNQPPAQAKQAIKKKTWVWVLLILLLVIIAAFIYWWLTRNNATTASPAPTATPTQSSPSPSTTPSAAVYDYTNKTYGFALNYPDSWGKCKINESKIEGSEMTFYLNCPTTDQSFAAGNSIELPGYYSPMAISVFTPAEWTTAQQSEGPKDTLLKQSNNYYFGWSQANGQLPSDWTEAMWNNHDPLINSFKLN
jgi:hypothetical protein